MLAAMRTSLTLVVGAVCLLAGASSARADQIAVPQISKDAPLAGLPAVSNDGAAFARPVRVQPKGCAGVQSFVELGTVGARGAEPVSKLLVVADECSNVPDATIAKNLATVNDTLRKGYRSTGAIAGSAAPVELTAGTRKLAITAAGGTKVKVAIVGSAADQWTVSLDGALLEVRGAYEGTGPTGKPYVSVLVASAAKDTGAKGRERWLDFWPLGSSVETDGPVDVAARFVDALIARDRDALGAAISAPFWKVGLVPGGSLAKSCKKANAAKKAAAVPTVTRCLAGAAGEPAPGDLYQRFGKVTERLAEIDMDEFPDELRRHKRKVARLVKGEHKLVRWHVNEDGVYGFLILVLDPDTNYQTVNAVLEAITYEK